MSTRTTGRSSSPSRDSVAGQDGSHDSYTERGYQWGTAMERELVAN